MLLVPRTGFEPVISAVRGRRPKPLDQRGAHGCRGRSRTLTYGTRTRCPTIRRPGKVKRSIGDGSPTVKGPYQLSPDVKRERPKPLSTQPDAGRSHPNFLCCDPTVPTSASFNPELISGPYRVEEAFIRELLISKPSISTGVSLGDLGRTG